jgi:hypothetical protein
VQPGSSDVPAYQPQFAARPMPPSYTFVRSIHHLYLYLFLYLYLNLSVFVHVAVTVVSSHHLRRRRPRIVPSCRCHRPCLRTRSQCLRAPPPSLRLPLLPLLEPLRRASARSPWKRKRLRPEARSGYSCLIWRPYIFFSLYFSWLWPCLHLSISMSVFEVIFFFFFLTFSF